jgi:hypothetical protein
MKNLVIAAALLFGVASAQTTYTLSESSEARF